MCYGTKNKILMKLSRKTYLQELLCPFIPRSKFESISCFIICKNTSNKPVKLANICRYHNTVYSIFFTLFTLTFSSVAYLTKWKYTQLFSLLLEFAHSPKLWKRVFMTLKSTMMLNGDDNDELLHIPKLTIPTFWQVYFQAFILDVTGFWCVHRGNIFQG